MNENEQTSRGGTTAPFRLRGFRASVAAILALLCTCGCTVLTYTGPNGERFARSSLGSTTSLTSLLVEASTNGIRRVELRGYRNDSNQALTTVTEAAVRAALQSR